MLTYTSNVLAKMNHVCERVTETLLTKGYYMAPAAEDWGETWKDITIPEVNMRVFARRVAKEHKRPFVQVGYLHRYDPETKTHPRCGIYIEMKKRKHLAPLIHPLTLAGFNETTRWRGHYKTLWNFHISDLDFAEEYLKFFETREDFRKALRLPPK